LAYAGTPEIRELQIRDGDGARIGGKPNAEEESEGEEEQRRRIREEESELEEGTWDVKERVVQQSLCRASELLRGGIRVSAQK
jgi:hypothetical protein